MEAIETEEVLWIITTEDFRVIQVLEYSFLCFEQRYTYRVLQTIQMNLMLLWVWAEWVVLGRAKTALKFKYDI